MTQLSYMAIPGIRRFYPLPVPQILDGKEILNILLIHFNLSFEQLNDPYRGREIVRPRQITMFLLRRHGKMKLKAIGDMFERDHTTVMAACEKVKDLFDSGNDELKEMLFDAELKLYSKTK